MELSLVEAVPPAGGSPWQEEVVAHQAAVTKGKRRRRTHWRAQGSGRARSE